MKTIRNLFIAALLTYSYQASAQLTHDEVYQLRDLFYSEFAPDLTQLGHKLTINPPPAPSMPHYWLDLEMRHASYSTFVNELGQREHYLFVFGGMARFPNTTKDAVALTLCHELGHGIGGEPYKAKPETEPLTSVEGQSDYFAAHSCIKRIMKHIPMLEIPAPHPYAAQTCPAHFSTPADIQFCYRFFRALELEREFYRTQPKIEEETNYETPDKSIAPETNLVPTYYPSAQCRLDTLIAGYLGQERPACWWKKP